MDTTTLDRFYEYADGKESDQTTGMVSRYWYNSANYDSAYFKYSYAYDALGNISSYSQHGTTYTYNYDDQNQLISQSGGGKTYTYTYDNAGNIKTASNGTTTNSYTYGNALWKDQLTAFNGQTITYDASGNPLSYYNGRRYTFTWEEGRNLVSAVEGTNTYTYAYDSDGLRISKTVNGVKHEYLYASGKLLRETVSENGVVTAVLDFVYDHSGHPFALNYTVDGTTTRYYYITNLQGDVLAMITGQGVVVASYSYDPYGKVISATKEMADINPLRYRGYYYDVETGFYYLQSRYFDSNVGRFINSDGMLQQNHTTLSTNLYAYCQNNPVITADYSGYDAIILFNVDGVGHTGILIEDENGNWYHFYWGKGDDAGLVKCILGANVPSKTWCKEYTGELTLDAINGSKQYANDYEHMLYLAGDFSACIDAMTNASGDYNLYNNNCNQKSLSILAQIESPYQGFLEEAAEIVIPANSYDYLEEDVNAVNREKFPTFHSFKDYWEAKYD